MSSPTNDAATHNPVQQTPLVSPLGRVSTLPINAPEKTHSEAEPPKPTPKKEKPTNASPVDTNSPEKPSPETDKVNTSKPKPTDSKPLDVPDNPSSVPSATATATVNPEATEVQSVVNPRKDEFADKILNAIKTLEQEVENAAGDAKKEAEFALSALRELEPLVNKAKTSEELNHKDAANLLRGLNTSRKAIERIAASGAKGEDGKTLTERMRDNATEVVTKETIVSTLEEINSKKQKANEKIAEFGNIKDSLRQGLGAFLGPAGPVLDTLFQLKQEYGEGTKSALSKLGVWIKGEKDIVKELEKQALGNNARDSKLLGFLTDKFSKFSIGGLGAALASSLSSIFSPSSKPSVPPTGTKAPPSAPGKVATAVKKLPGGEKLLSFGSSLGSKLGSVGAGAAKMLGRFLPGVGIGIGTYGLYNTEKAKDSDTTTDKALAYGGGALDGAALGAGIGGFIPVVGTVIGGFLGAIFGVVYTLFARNWEAVKDKLFGIWKAVDQGTGDIFGKIYKYGSDFLGFHTKIYESVSAGINKFLGWARTNIPGFGALMDTINKATVAGVAVVSQAITPAPAADATAPSSTQSASSSPTSTAPSVDTTPVTPANAPSDSGVSIGDTKIAPIDTPPITEIGGTVLAQNSAKPSAGATPPLMPSADVKDAIYEASKETGVSKSYLLAVAAHESGFDPKAKTKVKGGTASGLNQFIDSTWKALVDKYGKKYGITYEDKLDPRKNALMGALFAKDIALYLKDKGHEPSPANIAIGHWLGSFGAHTFLTALKKTPNASAVDLLPEAAAKNPTLFYKDGGKTPKTIKETYLDYSADITGRAQQYEQEIKTNPNYGEASAMAKGSTPSNGVATPTGGSGIATPATAPSSLAYVSPKVDDYNRATYTSPKVIMPPTDKSDNRMGVASMPTVDKVSAGNIPTILGDTPFVVMNAGMVGS